MAGVNELVEGVERLELQGVPGDNNVFPLLDLPDVVVQKLLKYFNVWTLMDLRLVCKKINSQWIDGLHLDKFVLCIKNHAHLEEIVICQNGPKWTNVKIICDAEMHNETWISNPLYGSLLKKLSNSLTILTLEEHRVPNSGVLTILKTCKVLKNLDIGTLDCKKVDVQEFQDPSVVKSLGNLEHLLIRYLAWNVHEELQLFENLLSQCVNLISLKAPHILMASLFSIGDTDDEDADRKYLELIERRLTRPIIDLVKTMSSSKLTLKYLDVDNLHHTEVFPSLIKVCWENNIRLLNVSEAYENNVPEDEDRFSEAIESLNGFTSFLNFKRLTNLRSITLDNETSADSAVHKDSIDAPLPQLQRISFCLPEDIDPSILKCLLEQPRPSVSTLSIEFEVSLTKLSNLFKPSLVVNNFPNLSSLSLIQWDGCDEDLNMILNSFPNLSCLRLQRCLNVTDKGLIGGNLQAPVLSTLIGLKRLWVDCQITDVLLSSTICHMELEELFFSSEKITASGFLALAGGRIASSLVVFQGTQPNNCSDEDFEAALKKFKNLKRGPKYFEYYAGSALASHNWLGRR